MDMARPKYEAKLVHLSETDFDSIISDCQQLNDCFVATSYDKTLRVLDKNFEMKAQKEFSNILTRVHRVAEDVFAIGQSK